MATEGVEARFVYRIHVAVRIREAQMDVLHQHQQRSGCWARFLVSGIFYRMVCVMSATNRGTVRRADDFYQTPMALVNRWADVCAMRVGYSPDHFVFDIGAGDGRIGSLVRDTIQSRHEPFGIDINPRGNHQWIWKGDYLRGWVSGSTPAVLVEQFTGMSQPILFVSNPPFSLAGEIVRRTALCLRGCPPGSAAVFLLRLNFLGSRSRSKWLNEYRPAALDIISPRPSFTGGKTDATEYALIWWSADYPSTLSQSPINFLTDWR